MNRSLRMSMLVVVLLFSIVACQMPGANRGAQPTGSNETPSFPLPGSALGSSTPQGTEPKGTEGQPESVPAPSGQDQPDVCPIPLGWSAITVQAGDTAESLAQQHGISTQELLDANCLLTAELTAGATLNVPAAPQEVLIPIVPVGGTQEGTPAPGALAADATEHKLRRGEFPYCIARRYDIHPNDLLSANGLVRGQIYRGGLVLELPDWGRAFPGERSLRPHPASYTVQKNDNIYMVACYYGDVTPEAIAAANALEFPYALTVGAVLSIP